MKSIYRDGDYTVYTDYKVAEILNNGKSKRVPLGPISPLTSDWAAKLKAAGVDPSDYVLASGTPLRKKAAPAWEKATSEAYEIAVQKALKLEKNVPGLEQLENAFRREESATYQTRRQIEQGERFNAPEKVDVDALIKKYPRAAVYLKAESYSQASNLKKHEAGLKAQIIILEGGSIQEAERILDNWSSQ